MSCSVCVPFNCVSDGIPGHDSAASGQLHIVHHIHLEALVGAMLGLVYVGVGLAWALGGEKQSSERECFFSLF